MLKGGYGCVEKISRYCMCYMLGSDASSDKEGTRVNLELRGKGGKLMTKKTNYIREIFLQSPKEAVKLNAASLKCCLDGSIVVLRPKKSSQNASLTNIAT